MTNTLPTRLLPATTNAASMIRLMVLGMNICKAEVTARTGGHRSSGS